MSAQGGLLGGTLGRIERQLLPAQGPRAVGYRQRQLRMQAIRSWPAGSVNDPVAQRAELTALLQQPANELAAGTVIRMHILRRRRQDQGGAEVCQYLPEIALQIRAGIGGAGTDRFGVAHARDGGVSGSIGAIEVSAQQRLEAAIGIAQDVLRRARDAERIGGRASFLQALPAEPLHRRAARR